MVSPKRLAPLVSLVVCGIGTVIGPAVHPGASGLVSAFAAPGRGEKKSGKASAASATASSPAAASSNASSASSASSAAALSASAHGAPAGSSAVPVQPPSMAPARDGQELLTASLPKLDPSPRVVGTCESGARDKGPLRFGLAHFNDLQARYSDLLGGRSRYAYIAGYLRQLKTEQPTIVLDAGDDYEKGALAEVRSNGETTRQMVQALPIDVRTVGNHDFAYGETAVLRDVRLSQHPVLAANVKHAGLPSAKQPFRPYARVDVGCVKIGVIGLVTQNFGADDRPTSAPYSGVFVQDDRYQAILEREAKAHRSEVDVLIALTHLGYAEDVALARKGGRLVDIIVGGHTEDVSKEPGMIVHPDNTKTWVLQAGRFGEVLGRGDVVVNPTEHAGGRSKIGLEKYRLVEVDEKMPVAEDVAALAKRLEDAVVPDAHTPIGRLSAPIKQGKPITELVSRAAKTIWNLDVVVLGKDLFWAGLPKGDLTLQRLYDAVLVQRQPAGTSGLSSLWVVELTGAEMTALQKASRVGGTYEWFGPRDRFDPGKRYRLGLDKRAATYPKTLFGGEAKLVRASYLGEMIDALEPFVKARSSKGQTVD